MNVPVQILENLKCSNCEDLLSCGPVLLKQDGSNICGRCSNLEESAVANKPYNELAELCMFPCKYEADGCYEKVSFSSVKKHEMDCEFRTYICPVMPSGSCEWLGFRNNIKEHIEETHPEKILNHPCEMEHDVTIYSLKTFLTTVFDVLFIIYVKVCLTTHTLYYSVRRIGAEDNKIYKYEINISNDNTTLIKKCEVAPQGILAMQEDTSIAFKINTLIEIVTGFKNTKFVVTVKQFMKCYKCDVIKNANETEVYDNVNHIFFCTTCASALLRCKNSSKGCIWKGTENHINHQELFCTFSKWCSVCKKNINEFNMLDHFRNKKHTHYDIYHVLGEYWSIQKDKKEVITFSFKNMSYLFIYSNKENSMNDFFIQGRPSCANKTKCQLILRNRNTKYVSHYIMREYYNFKHGQFIWGIFLHDDVLKPFINDNKFEIWVDIYYNE